MFHVFCDTRAIPEALRSPASTTLMAAFIAAAAGAYSGKTLANYFYAIRAWHVIHGVQWDIDRNQMEAMLKAASSLTPATSKRLPREPYTVEGLALLLAHIDVSQPLGAAAAACFTTASWGVAHVGELTLPNLNSFDPTCHVKPSNMRHTVNRSGLVITALFVPKTKSNTIGEDIYWATQPGLPADPDANFNQHLLVNEPPTDGPLFAYRHRNGHRPLTRSTFLGIIAAAAKCARTAPLQGHSLRIGGTLEYLLRSIPFDVVKAKAAGRAKPSWSTSGSTRRSWLHTCRPAQPLTPSSYDTSCRPCTEKVHNHSHHINQNYCKQSLYNTWGSAIAPCVAALLISGFFANHTSLRFFQGCFFRVGAASQQRAQLSPNTFSLSLYHLVMPRASESNCFPNTSPPRLD